MMKNISQPPRLGTLLYVCAIRAVRWLMEQRPDGLTSALQPSDGLKGSPKRRASQRIIIFYHGTILTDHGAKEELKSGSLAPPLPTRAARRQRCTPKPLCGAGGAQSA